MEDQPIKFSESLKNKESEVNKNDFLEDLDKSNSDYLVNNSYTSQYGLDVTKFGTKLSDGTYSFKDQDIKTNDTPESLEERYSSKQGSMEKWKNGLLKSTAKVGVYAVDALAGTAYGIVNAVSEGSLNALYDNDFAHYLDDINTQLDNELPNYYSANEKEMGFINSLGTANFWANDFAGGLAFLGGTVLSEGILAAATGGGSLATTLPRMALKTAAKTALKTSLKAGVKKGVKTRVLKEVLKAQKNAVLKKGVIGEGLDLIGFSARSSIFEAGMEARHGTKEAIDNYVSNYVRLHGEEPSGEELNLFINDAKNSANGLFVANVAVLIPSNLMMFGKLGTKSLKQATSNSFVNRKIFGLGYNEIKGEGGKLTFEAVKSNLTQRVAGKTYKLLKQPVVEGLWEEGLQGVASKTMVGYLDAKYDSKTNIENLSLMNNFYDAFAEQYGTSAGWKENLLGGMIGMVGGSFSSFTTGLKGGIGNAIKSTEGISGFGKQSYRAAVAENIENISEMNKATAKMFDRVNNLSTLAVNEERAKLSESERENTDNGIEDWAYINTMAHHKSAEEIKEDYNHTVDNLEIDKETQKELNLTDEEVTAYKESKKSKFNDRVDSALKAKKAIKYLKLDSGVTEGNQKLVEDALAYAIYNGSESLANTKKLAEQLNKIVGTKGALNSIDYYNSLSKTEQESVDRVKELTEEVEKLTKQSVRLAGVQKPIKFKSKRKAKKAKKKQREHNFREEEQQVNINIVGIHDEILDKEAEIEDLKKKLNLKKNSGGVNFDEIFNIAETSEFSDNDVTAVIEDLDTLDAYVESLELEGKQKEANVVKGLVQDLKFNLDSARETANQYEEMIQPDYFKSEGDSRFLDRVLGDKYKMSEDTIELIRKNNDKVTKSLLNAGIKTKNTVEAYIQEIVEGADNLSDRNKFHLEMMIRNIIKADGLEFSIPAIPTSVPTKQETKDGITRSGAKLEEIKVDINANPTLDYLKELIETIIKSSNQLGALIQRKNPKIAELRDKLVEVDKLVEEESTKNAETREENNKLKTERQTELEKLEEDLILNKIPTEEIDKAYKRVDELEAELKSLEEVVEESTYSKEKEQLEQELEEELSKEEDTKIQPSKEEYTRLEELLAKKQLTDEETDELDNLKAFVDQWIKLDGTIVDGVSMSTLMEQKAVLENLVVNLENEINNSEANEIFESAKAIAINATQNFNKVFSKVFRNKLEVSGLTLKGFATKIKATNIDELPLKPERNTSYTLKTEHGDLVITIDGIGVITLNKDDIEILNKTPIKVVNTSKDLHTNYSVVLEEVDGELQILDSNFPDEFVEGATNELEIYKTKEGEVVNLQINLGDEHNMNLLKGANEKLSKKEKEALKVKLKKELVISVYTSRGKDGNFTGVLKSQRESEQISIATERFNAIRDHIVERYFNEIISNDEVVKLSAEEVTVSSVYLGHPKYDFKVNNGTVETVFKPISEKEAVKIVDIGYIENGGTPVMKNETKDVDATFLGKFADKKGVTGLIVLEHAGRNIYYPVNTNKRPTNFSNELNEIYKSGKPSAKMASDLNAKLNEAGINTKKEGFVFGGKASNLNNINDAEIKNKLAQLKNKDYFYNVKEWVNEKVDIKSKALSEMEINIDLLDPFHSPKLQLDFSKIEVENPPAVISNSSVGQGSAKLNAILGC